MLKVVISHQIKKETFWFRLAYIKAKKAWKKVCPLMRDPSFKAWQRTDKEKKVMDRSSLENYMGYLLSNPHPLPARS